MTTRSVIFTLFLFCTAFNAHALSCAPLKERFISECSTTECGKVIRVKETYGALPCETRPIVDESPIWLREVIHYEMKRSQLKDTAVYTLTARSTFWHDVYRIGSLEDYKKATEKETDRRLLALELTAQPGTLEATESEWKNRERQDYLIYLAKTTIDRLLLVIGIIITLYSIKWLKYGLRKRLGRWITLSAFSTGTLFYFAITNTGLLIDVFVLVLPPIWVSELIYCAYFKVRYRGNKPEKI